MSADRPTRGPLASINHLHPLVAVVLAVAIILAIIFVIQVASP